MNQRGSEQDPGETDPYLEPANSTVDDWLGQRVQRDERLADELVEETGGDLEEAERLFDRQSDERAEYEAAHEQGPSGEAARSVEP